MKRVKAICFLLIVHCTFTDARDNLRLPDARTLGMGGNGVSHSALFNPALLALQTEKELRVDYYNRYSLNELATVSGGFCFPNEVLPTGLHVASFGYDGYRESLFRLSAGKQLNPFWTLGVSVQYAVIQSELFETDASRLSTDLGATCRPVDNWLVTLSVLNFPSVSLNSENVDSERIGSYLVAVGVNWQMMNNLLITGGIAHNKETPFDASIGMEYLPVADFHFRTGLRTFPFRPSLGFGYRFTGLTADVVMIYHPVLGVSTGLGLSYSF